jgi:hypothetical protein
MGIFTEGNKGNEEMPDFSYLETHGAEPRLGKDARATTVMLETALDKNLGLA